MATLIEAYYDFRSPYAYFAAWQIHKRKFVASGQVEWRWRPVSIDILLNLQAGREPCAPYVDPLAPPKRRHLLADVRRSAEFYGAPLGPPRASRPNPVPALCTALILEQTGVEHEAFRMAVFDEMWRVRSDIGSPDVIGNCLCRAALDRSVLAAALTDEARSSLTAYTMKAYGDGVFGVPSFVLDGEIFFGADRLDMLAWRLRARARAQ
jgi:2-hydroxychromene-2-carboxylate isomerase